MDKDALLRRSCMKESGMALDGKVYAWAATADAITVGCWAELAFELSERDAGMPLWSISARVIPHKEDLISLSSAFRTAVRKVLPWVFFTGRENR